MALGEVDYGLFGVVGGLTAFIAYFNGILSGAIGRYFAVSIGEQQKSVDEGLDVCRMWFTTAFVLNSVVPTLLMLVGYPIGVWVVRNFLTIPADRLLSCVWVWRFVCLTCYLGMITLPFRAMYSAKQYIAELTIYSFITTTLNASFLYYMVTHPSDWLAKYAFWQCMLNILPQSIIAIRAYFIFPECRVVKKYLNCWGNIKKLSGYAFWNAWGTLGAMLRAQGNAILINKYFGPRINAGFSVGSHLSGHTNMLSGEMIGAFSPAIYNAWGSGDYDLARRLAYRTCKMSTLFILIFAIPLALEVDEVLLLWLKNPPCYAAGFCWFVIGMNVIDKMAVGHMIMVNANGKIAKYQAFLGTSLVMTLPFAWLFIVLGGGVFSVGIAMVGTMIFCALGRVWFARSLVGMSSKYWIKQIAMPLSALILVCLLVGALPSMFISPSFWRICLTTLTVEIVLIPISWIFILNDAERNFIKDKILKLLKR